MGLKSTKSRKKIVLSAIGIGFIVLALSYYAGFFFSIGVSTCIIPPPPHIMVDGMAFARVYAWNDENENGVVDKGEAALPKVEIKYPFSSTPQYTDHLGEAVTGQFKPGCACNCWEYEYVEVIAPQGYRPTTPLRQEMTGDNLRYTFGFVKIHP